MRTGPAPRKDRGPPDPLQKPERLLFIFCVRVFPAFVTASLGRLCVSLLCSGRPAFLIDPGEFRDDR